MISGISSNPNYLINRILDSDNLDMREKAMKSLSMFSESNNLSASDLKRSFEILEECLIKYLANSEFAQSIAQKTTRELLIAKSMESKGLNELIALFKAIVDIKHTKYEYDFDGYLANSESSILKVISEASGDPSNVQFKIVDDKIVLEEKSRR